VTELAQQHSTVVGHWFDERQRGDQVTERARSRNNTAPSSGTGSTSASEEIK
jgi:hypothetical protein